MKTKAMATRIGLKFQALRGFALDRSSCVVAWLCLLHGSQYSQCVNEFR